MACHHVVEFFNYSTNIKAYRSIVQTLVYPKSAEGIKRKTTQCCSQCNAGVVCQCILACAHCIHVSCWDHKHIYGHARSKRHPLSVSLNRGDLFCYECKDFKYYAVSDTVQQMQRREYLNQFGIYDSTWRPSWQEISLLSYVAIAPSNAYRPMRGLVNMGNTCFLNVVVQAMTHTPLLRDFLLSDSHRCPNPKQSKACLVCEMMRITQEIHKSSASPVVPSNLLSIIWIQAIHLAGYEQRDAHELLITMLYLMHKAFVSTDGSGTPINSGSDNGSSASVSEHSSNSKEAIFSCECIVHQIFNGHLESTISYEGCGHSSKTVDPFADLSLDVVSSGTDSLDSCIRSYTRPENMDGLRCCECEMARPAIKQFSLLKLPNVLCFHLKRCQHDSKINTKVSFYEELDLAPYLAHVNGETSRWEDKYSLYAVLNHQGETNSGHYTCYIRSCRDSWCLCDDQKIAPVSLEEVLQTDAYVLLYHKNCISARD